MEERELCLDVLVGYPRALGIEIATRSLNSELIVCDEIGEGKEAEAIVSAQNCGVPFGDDLNKSLPHRTSPRRVLNLIPHRRGGVSPPKMNVAPGRKPRKLMPRPAN